MIVRPLPDVHPLLPLHSRRDREFDRIVIEGRIAIDRALEAGVSFDLVLANEEQLKTFTVPDEVEVFLTDQAGFEKHLGFPFHRGIVAMMNRSSWMPALPRWNTERVLIPVLAQLADPVNVGAIVRSGAAFGASAVVADNKGADPYSRRSMRASMGSVFTVPTLVREPLSVLSELRLQRADTRVIALAPSGECTLDELSPQGCDVLLLGHEGSGLSDELFAEADLRVGVPISDRVDSLNVAAAAAIVLHALRALKNCSSASVCSGV